MPRTYDCDEELGFVGVLAGIRHGHDPRTIVLDRKRLVLKIVTVHTLAASTVAASNITTLNHEPGNNPVKHRVFVMKGFPHLTYSILSRTESHKILNGDGSDITVPNPEPPPEAPTNQ